MIPSGMFLLTSVALAVGVIKLFKKNTLVQDLYSLEMLARVDTICFDKTGTITDGRMTVQKVLKLSAKDDTDVDLVMSSMLKSLKDNNQTAIALYNYFGQENKYTATYTLPFNSSRKFSAVTFEDRGTYCFGAPEFVLSHDNYAKIKDEIEAYAKNGLRVLVLAHSNLSLTDDFIPTDFEFVSLIVIADNVRDDAIATIKWFKDNGVQIKVISGDNPVTVARIAQLAGIKDARKYVDAGTLKTDRDYAEALKKYTFPSMVCQPVYFAAPFTKNFSAV
jgi:cation-transporting ATPase E